MYANIEYFKLDAKLCYCILESNNFLNVRTTYAVCLSKALSHYLVRMFFTQVFTCQCVITTAKT